MNNKTKIFLGLAVAGLAAYFILKPKTVAASVPLNKPSVPVAPVTPIDTKPIPDPVIPAPLDVFIPPIHEPYVYTGKEQTPEEIQAALLSAAQTTPDTAGGGKEIAKY